MRRHAIDRWADTTLFRLVLLFAGFAVVPVLLMGISVTVIGGGTMLAGRAAAALEIEHAVVALLSVLGTLGFVGYLRAHSGIKDPSRHNVTATLVLIAAGVLAAVSVGGFVAATAVASWLEPWGSNRWLLLGALLAAANFLWAFSGVAWMQRLMHGYAEHAGSPFDGLPPLLLSVSVALATAATLIATTL